MAALRQDLPSGHRTVGHSRVDSALGRCYATALICKGTWTMARGRKGRDISGWLVVDKPAGLTSTAVVNKVRWALDAKKAGHAGTLDPDATGVLAVALGEATKTVPYITDALKAYRFTIRLGVATNTDDAEGEVIATSDLRPSDDDIKEALHGFVGDIHAGAAAILGREDRWRAGLQARPRRRGDGDRCARSLCRELADRDSTPRCRSRDAGNGLRQGRLCPLHRAGSGREAWAVSAMCGNCAGPGPGRSRPKDGITLDEVERLARTPELDAYATAAGSRSRRSAAGALRCRGGGKAAQRQSRHGDRSDVEYGDECWAAFDGRAVAVGRYKAGEVWPDRVFR